MNRKHLIQLVATLGAMIVLYVLSIGPVFAFSHSASYDSVGGLTRHQNRMESIYLPILWLGGEFPLLGQPIAWWVIFWTKIVIKHKDWSKAIR